MFNNLTEFSYKRNYKEAIGFYLAYSLVCLIVSGTVSGLAGSIQLYVTGVDKPIDVGLLALGDVMGIIYSLIISFMVLMQRTLHNNFWWVILALLSGLLAVLFGWLLGLALPAFMTTRGIATTETQSV